MMDVDIYCKVSGMAADYCGKIWRDTSRMPTVIEIGCAEGDGTMRYAAFAGLVVCIDPFGPSRGDFMSRERGDTDIQFNEARFSQFASNTSHLSHVRVVVGCSQWSSTHAAVKELLGERRADIVIVDGTHHPYELVLADVEAYAQFLSPDGYMIMDDTYEPCIAQVVDKMVSDGWDAVEHWGVKRHNILQEITVLRRGE